MASTLACIALYEILTASGWQHAKIPVRAYCPCAGCCGEHKTTATGGDPLKRGIAASRASGIPRGAWVQIPGYGCERVDDHSPAKEAQVEVRLRSHDEAVKWGVQELDVFWHEDGAL